MKDRGAENQNEKNKITIEKLKKNPGLENLTDSEAEEAIDTIYKLSHILIKIMKKEAIEKSKKKLNK